MATNGYDCGGLRIEAVKNGFIVHVGTHLCAEKYVFSNLKTALKFIEESFKDV